MNNYIFIGTLAGLAVGAACGAVVGWQMSKRKLEETIAVDQQKIWDEAKEYYESKSEKSSEEKTEETKPEKSGVPKHLGEKGPISEYEKHIKEHKYDTRSDNIPDRTNMKALEKRNAAIKLLSDEEYAMISDEEYDMVTFTYYDNDILTDERGSVLDNYEAMIGSEWLDKFNETGSVYILNERLKICYEIIRDLNDYPLEEDRTEIEVE